MTRVRAATAAHVRRTLIAQASSSRAAALAKFFKTGPGEYAAGDRFLGITVPMARRIAKQFHDLPEAQIDRLLCSPLHEARLTALLIMVGQFERGDERLRGRLYRLYRRRLEYVNNWDLVDASAEYIVGAWLADRPRAALDRLARSRHLWSRRVSMVATMYFIRRGDERDALRIAERLLPDSHDLIHKACGWMLREVGKRVDPALLRAFLQRHGPRMPRTTLRYAIERFGASERARWLRIERRAA